MITTFSSPPPVWYRPAAVLCWFGMCARTAFLEQLVCFVCHPHNAYLVRGYPRTYICYRVHTHQVSVAVVPRPEFVLLVQIDHGLPAQSRHDVVQPSR